MPVKKTFNPFYLLLVVLGVAFAITACAYAVMTVRGIDPAGSTTTAEGQSLLNWLASHGFTLMMVELGLLAVATVGAIGTDEYWMRRARRREQNETREASHESQTL